MTLEPVAVINASVAIIEAAIALAVGFGLDLTGEQVGLPMAGVGDRQPDQDHLGERTGDAGRAAEG